MAWRRVGGGSRGASVTDGCDVIDDVCEHVRMGANPDMVADFFFFWGGGGRVEGKTWRQSDVRSYICTSNFFFSGPNQENFPNHFLDDIVMYNNCM